jgi:PHP family Zn ribbon phosphoesterase
MAKAKSVKPAPAKALSKPKGKSGLTSSAGFSIDTGVSTAASAEENTKASKASKSLTNKIVKTTTKSKSYTVDLRISSPSSLGYLGIEGIDTAPALVRLARVKRLDIIAVTDFYHAGFIDRLSRAAENSFVTVLPGVVVRAAIPECNEVILVCIFPSSCSGTDVEALLQELEVPRGAAHDANYILSKSLNEVLAIIERRGAVAIPSRMDQTPYRKLAIKPLIERYGFRAFDLAHSESSREYFTANWGKQSFQFFSFSNAAALAQIGCRSSKVKLDEPGFEGVRMLTERVL